ncbi:MAG TPA: alpha-L-arabinofuranosidase C-terminal domain-containing protein, partial [Pyrinomonadaceae bacterium]|nr:alpha-L-arabinofuranosidase C-terminal domain-containing protein [Pyrinomonadaceae bacterium]
VTVSRSADGKRIFIKAVNTNPTSALATTINLQGVTPAPRAELKTITAPSLSVYNDFSQPNAVSTSSKTISAGRQFVVTLPKHAVSVITLSQNRP